MSYRKYSDYLKEKYGEKVYKIPIVLPITCPNRDGCLSYGGCDFCGENAVALTNDLSGFDVKEQIEKQVLSISKKHQANKFIAYFQNFTNTYMPIDDFERVINQAVQKDIVEIVVSTRPDSIAREYLEVLASVKNKFGVEISIELGLQTVNYKTLKKINRGHTLAEFIDAVLMIKEYGFTICTHLILNLPYDDLEDVIEMSKIVSSLKVDFVKLHSLYIVKNTKFEQEYKNKQFEICTLDEYKNRLKEFLMYLDPNIAIERIFSKSTNDTLFINWYTNMTKLNQDFEQELINENVYQGKKFNYLGGKTLKTKKYV